MRFLLILSVFMFAGCGGESSDETAADGLQESIDTNIENAEGVEDALQEAVDDLDAAIDEASGEG